MSDKVVEDLIYELESLIQQDEGGRGIRSIALKGQLAQAAKVLLSCEGVAIITGFPCLLDYDIPTETDGPLGALAIAKTCLGLGKKVAIFTDECNEQVLLAAAAASNLQQIYNAEEMESDIECESFVPAFVLESFPPLASFEECDQARLDRLMKHYGVVLAIERAGPSRTGQYLTMRKRDMTSIIAPLDRIITSDKFSIGIGDGGNEVGMGKVHDKILKSSIPFADEISCVTATDYLIVSSVSNWGGYAVCAAITALAVEQEPNSDVDTRESMVNFLMPTCDEQIQICQRMVDAGARDGITAEQELKVDGMPLEISLELILRLRDLVVNFYKH